MFEMFPNIDIGKDAKYPLSSYLFGHRMRPNQSDIEYLIEFLQVMLAKKSWKISHMSISPRYPEGRIVRLNTFQRQLLHSNGSSSSPTVSRRANCL